jgi:glutamate--cysteine ligase
MLENLHEQYLLPPLHAGWAVRRKTNHFQPTRRWPRSSPSCWAWTLADQPDVRQCGEVNFPRSEGWSAWQPMSTRC